METSLHIIKSAGARIHIAAIEIGKKVYLRGNTAGIEPSTRESLRITKAFYKAAITSPQGGGFKSLNVTARKMFRLYAKARPCVSYHPFVKAKHLDQVIEIAETESLRTFDGKPGYTMAQGQ